MRNWINDVNEWAEQVGIHKGSTENIQVSYALKEIGEYITAEEYEERKLELGDIAVCIANAAWFGTEIDVDAFESLPASGYPYSGHLDEVASSVISGHYLSAMIYLRDHAEAEGMDFQECLNLALEKIQKRVQNGRMVNGEFVKYQDLPADLQAQVDVQYEV